jgi:hypothetical protein
VRRDPGHRVDLHPEVRDPEVVDDVLGLDVELHRLPGGQVELRGRELLAALVVGEAPGELLPGDATTRSLPAAGACSMSRMTT